MARPIDHLVLAAHDLSSQAALYRRLGFQVGARNRHPWGTENHIVQLDGSFLELISLGDAVTAAADPRPRVFSFAGFVQRFLGQREGCAMLVLRSQDAKRDCQQFRTAGIGDFEPFCFSRKARRPDGTAVEVAFTLAFAQSPAIEAAGFFVCQQHFPENFWNPAFQQHDNTASRLAAVTMIASNPEALVGFVQAFANTQTVRKMPSGIEIDTFGGRINVVTAAGFCALYGEAAAVDGDEPRLAALDIAVADLSKAETLFQQSGVTFARQHDRLVVAPAAAFGCAIAFVR
jgi:hypothetical protein